MYSCDYNGWADVPEEEREGIDAFEAVGPPSMGSTSATGSIDLRAYELNTLSSASPLPQRKAA